MSFSGSEDLNEELSKLAVRGRPHGTERFDFRLTAFPFLLFL